MAQAQNAAANSHELDAAAQKLQVEAVKIEREMRMQQNDINASSRDLIPLRDAEVSKLSLCMAVPLVNIWPRRTL